MSIFRGFIAIDIKATPQILTFEKEITKTDADVKLVEPENIHITVKFLGDTDENHIDTHRTKHERIGTYNKTISQSHSKEPVYSQIKTI